MNEGAINGNAAMICIDSMSYYLLPEKYRLRETLEGIQCAVYEQSGEPVAENWLPIKQGDRVTINTRLKDKYSDSSRYHPTRRLFE